MSLKRTVLLGSFAWIALLTGMHGYMNWGINPFAPSKAGAEEADKFKVGFIPVTCHLTCPVTDFINKNMTGEGSFQPMKFSGFPELKEMFISGRMEATFILAPLAMSLWEQGVPIKIVYLGHRDGTALMVHTDSDIRRIEDLRGKMIAVPNRYSNQRLLIFKALQERGIGLDEVTLVEMAPPDMPVALETRSVDAITSGEPYMGQTEMDGYGRVLYLTKDVWPNFISCVLAVSEEAINKDRAKVQALVDGIAKSGKWIDQSPDHRMEAAAIASRAQYYNQNVELMEFVLSKPPDRVKYTNLSLHRKDFEEIERLAKADGILEGTAHFDDYCDPSFAPDEAKIKAWEYEGRAARDAAKGEKGEGQ